MFLECDKGRHCLLSSALPQNSSSISMSCIPAWAIAQMWLIRLVNATYNKQFMTGPSLADQSAFHLDIHDVHSQWDVSLGLMFFWSRTGYIPNWCIYIFGCRRVNTLPEHYMQYIRKIHKQSTKWQYKWCPKPQQIHRPLLAKANRHDDANQALLARPPSHHRLNPWSSLYIRFTGWNS